MSLPGKWTLKADAARLNAVKAQRPLDAAISQTLKGLPTSAAAQHVCTITFGVKGDKAVKKYAKQVPAKAEAYYLDINDKGIVIVGADETGLFYGVQTLLASLAEGKVEAATVKDWPDVDSAEQSKASTVPLGATRHV